MTEPTIGSIWVGLGNTVEVVGEPTSEGLVPCMKLRGRSGQWLKRPTPTNIIIEAFGRKNGLSPATESAQPEEEQGVS